MPEHWAAEPPRLVRNRSPFIVPYAPPYIMEAVDVRLDFRSTLPDVEISVPCPIPRDLQRVVIRGCLSISDASRVPTSCSQLWMLRPLRLRPVGVNARIGCILLGQMTDSTAVLCCHCRWALLS